MKKTGLHLHEITTEDLINLSSLYLSEWYDRYNLHWDLNFKFFYADIIVLFLPNLSAKLGIDLSGFPAIVFPAVAAVLSLVFLYFSIGIAKRVEANSKAYARVTQFFPPELQRVSLISSDIKRGKLFNIRLDPILCYAMFLSLFFLSIVMIIYNLNNYT